MLRHSPIAVRRRYLGGAATACAFSEGSMTAPPRMEPLARVVHEACFPVQAKPRVLSAGFGVVRWSVDYSQ
jgi:hypothetical protein